MTKIKICGLTRIDDIVCVNQVKPDYIGFVFATSRRQVSIEQARRLKERLASDIQAVGVFDNQSAAEMIKLYDVGIIDIIQLHGPQNNQIADDIRACCAAPVIQAYGITEKSDLQRAWDSPSEIILLDNKQAGSGQAFHWDLAKDSPTPAGKQVFLAGGINKDNVQTAIAGFSPFAVDVSSGVETNGYKDPEKIAELVRRVQNGTGQIR